MSSSWLVTSARAHHERTLDDRRRHDHLLKRHAPVLHLDQRELFRPTAVDGYVSACEIVGRGGQPLGSATLDVLDRRWQPGTSLRFVSPQERRIVGRDESRRRVLSSRLGRVGLFGRLIDALFQLSVWIRPTIHRRTTAAAAAKAERHGLQTHPVCYGRAIRAGEWLVLHYAYFYVMNDWRSSYRGLNDHEADWEQAWIYCDPADDRPVWIATSSHDHSGADLRRHWDDPELQVVDDRPQLYVGAGSHAMFFRPGEYVTRIDIPALRWALRAQRWLQRALRVRDVDTTRGLGPALGVPFVDTATSNGPVVDGWDLRALAGEPWAEGYRGLWGIDTGDPLQGERGPSGPKFDRSGEIRSSWADPLGFAGLHGTPPPSARPGRINDDKLDRVIDELDQQIRHRGRMLPLAHQSDSADEMASESRRLTELLRHRCELDDLRQRITEEQWRTQGIRDHLRHPAIPVEPRPGGWMLAGWAAISVPIVLVAIAAVVLTDQVKVGGVALALVLASLPIEYIARRQFGAVVRLIVVEMAIVLFFAFVFGLVVSATRYALGGLILASGCALLVANTNELRSVLRTRRALRSLQPPPSSSAAI